MIYAKVDDNGYIVYTVQANTDQIGLIQIDYDIGECPGVGYQFNINTKTWVDTRTESQQYIDASQPIISQRDRLLYASDWTQIPNNPLTAEQQAAWAVYRQELRDVTNQSGYPFNVIWPTPPA